MGRHYIGSFGLPAACNKYLPLLFLRNPLSAPSSLTKIYLLTLRVVNLIPILFILNFSDESKLAATEKLSRTDQISETWLGLACLLCLVFALFAGVMLASQGYDVMHVPKKS